MTATYEPAQDNDSSEWQRQLDQLVPPPMGPFRKLLVGSTLVALAISFVVVVIGGYLYPNPFYGASFSSGSGLEVNTAEGLFGVRVLIPNYSQRPLRVTAATLDAEGAEVVEVVVGNELDRTTEPLPAFIETGGSTYLMFWLRPTQCTDPVAPWGIAEVTLDFGEGSFPPISRTLRVSEDPAWEGEEVFVYSSVESADGKGPLSVACEVLR